MKSRIIRAALWALGAILAVTLYLLVTVYLLNDYDRGYEQFTWFVLNLYLGTIITVAGLVGCVIATFVWKPAGAGRNMFFAGVAFAIAIQLFAGLLQSISPDQDMMITMIIAALFLGAGSVVLLRAVRLPITANARKKRR